MLKLNVCFNWNAGEANDGSGGASVNLEIKVESEIVREAQGPGRAASHKPAGF